MDAIFQLRKDLPRPADGTRVIKATDYQTFVRATEIINEAEKQARLIIEQSQQAYEQRRAEGYEQGLEEGKMEHAEKMMETILASVEFIENIERTVVSVVNQSVRKIIGDLDDKERITRIVHTALNTVRGQQRVTVRVSPADEAVVQEALEAMTTGSFMTVISDPRLERGRCLLESELGVVDASLETQLKALEHSFTAKIAQQA